MLVKTLFVHIYCETYFIDYILVKKIAFRLISCSDFLFVDVKTKNLCSCAESLIIRWVDSNCHVVFAPQMQRIQPQWKTWWPLRCTVTPHSDTCQHAASHWTVNTAQIKWDCCSCRLPPPSFVFPAEGRVGLWFLSWRLSQSCTPLQSLVFRLTRLPLTSWTREVQCRGKAEPPELLKCQRMSCRVSFICREMKARRRKGWAAEGFWEIPHCSSGEDPITTCVDCLCLPHTILMGGVFVWLEGGLGSGVPPGLRLSSVLCVLAFRDVSGSWLLLSVPPPERTINKRLVRFWHVVIS